MSIAGDPIEDRFWIDLEYRVSGEFPGMADKRLQHFWCDGFIPRDYFLDDPIPRIVGGAWIVEGQRQEPWTFTLFLGRCFPSRKEIDWESLLPPPNVTCWIALDLSEKHIQIEPSAVIADFELPPKRNAQNRGR